MAGSTTPRDENAPAATTKNIRLRAENVNQRRAGRRGKTRLLPGVVGRNLRIRPGLPPQDDLIAPGVLEGVVVAVEFLPVVVAPQFGCAALDRAGQDVLVRLAVAHQDPDARLAPLAGERARAHALGVGMRARVGRVEDAEVQVADVAV